MREKSFLQTRRSLMFVAPLVYTTNGTIFVKNHASFIKKHSTGIMVRRTIGYKRVLGLEEAVGAIDAVY